MPCRSDYLEPTEREQYLQNTAIFLCYVRSVLKKPVEEWIRLQAKDSYAKDDRVVPLLCLELRQLSPAQREAIVYDAHNPKARRLADWWDTHKENDKRREQREKQNAEDARIKAAALKKLTPKERKALGL